MFNVMLIDDDLPIRGYLREVIAWEKLNLHLVCEAGDSETARELYRLYRPDIVITDISIPIISGLELAREFIREDADLRIIVITGFGDFKNVRESVALGAIELLSKPIVPEEINASLEKASLSLQQMARRHRTEKALNELIAQNLSVMQERSMAELFNASAQVDEAQLHEQLRLLSLSFPAPYFAAVRINLDTRFSGDLRSAAFPTAFQKLCDETLKANGFYAFTFFGAVHQLDCIVNWPFPRGDERLEELLDKLLKETRFYFQTEFSAGIGAVVQSLGDIGASAAQAAISLQFSDPASPNIVNFRNLDRIAESQLTVPTQLIETLSGCIQAFRLDDFRAALDSWLLDPAASGDLEAQRKLALEFLSHMSDLCSWNGTYLWQKLNYPQTISNLFNVQSADEMRAVLLSIGEKLIHVLFHQRAKSKNQLISLAKAYIQNNLGNAELSIDMVSSHIGLSSNYFCQLFHREENVSFVTYLNAERIKLAKHLLRTTSKKVFEISDLAGYSNPKYFNYVFKRTVGLTPLRYREEAAGG